MLEDLHCLRPAVPYHEPHFDDGYRHVLGLRGAHEPTMPAAGTAEGIVFFSSAVASSASNWESREPSGNSRTEEAKLTRPVRASPLIGLHPLAHCGRVHMALVFDSASSISDAECCAGAGCKLLGSLGFCRPRSLLPFSFAQIC